MIDSVYSHSSGALATSLRSAFTGGLQWPIDRAGLAALIDLGLSNRQIGDYFSVGPDAVHLLREDYGYR
jgi:hypothetical protein